MCMPKILFKYFLNKINSIITNEIETKIDFIMLTTKINGSLKQDAISFKKIPISTKIKIDPIAYSIN